MSKEIFRDIGRYGAIGMEMVVCVLVGLAIGYLLEKKITSARPWATLVFTLLGFLAGIKRLLALNNKTGGLGGGNKRD